MEKIFVGNLPFLSTEEELRDLFAKWGNVRSVTLVRDENGDSRGFAFVEIADGKGAVEELDGVDFQGRVLRVRVASPRGHWYV